MFRTVTKFRGCIRLPKRNYYTHTIKQELPLDERLIAFEKFTEDKKINLSLEQRMNIAKLRTKYRDIVLFPEAITRRKICVNVGSLIVCFLCFMRAPDVLLSYFSSDLVTVISAGFGAGSLFSLSNNSGRLETHKTLKIEYEQELYQVTNLKFLK